MAPQISLPGPAKALPAEAAATLIDEFARGMPAEPAALRLSEVGAQRWSVPNEDLCLPVLTVSETAFEHNIELINAYAAEHGLFLCAHGKTMMAPQLLARVLRGKRTVGLCAATTQQAAVMAACGAPNVFIANQIVGRANVRKLAQLVERYPATRFLLLVDSVEGVDLLLPHLGGVSVSVLIEVGVPNGRAGIRQIGDARALIAYILAHRTDGLRLAGVASYEGAVPAGPDNPERIEALLALTADVYDSALEQGMPAVPAPIVSAGGSSTFDLVTRAWATRPFAVTPQIWLRPGVAPTYDHVVYQQRLAEMDQRDGFVLDGRVQSAVARFQPALALWAAVQSIPDGDTALIAAGIRDFPADAGYPTLLTHYRAGELIAEYDPGLHSMVRANDQHGYLPLGARLQVKVGDVLKFGVSHPCTAFDKWPVLFMVDDQNVVTDAIRTYF